MGYIKDCVRTECRDFDKIKSRVDNGLIRMLHGAIGISTEAGELLDAIKKHLLYGKELDKVNIQEEIGDLFYYCAIICDELGISFSEIQDRNIEKLKARYGDSFSEDRAIHRDLTLERKILEE